MTPQKLVTEKYIRNTREQYGTNNDLQFQTKQFQYCITFVHCAHSNKNEKKTKTEIVETGNERYCVRTKAFMHTLQ